MANRVKRLSSDTGALILLLVGSLVPICVSAQEPIVPLQFSFSDPGARSMGFGGAFVALADDASRGRLWGAGLLAGTIWLTTRYAPIPTWINLLLALFAIVALFVAHFPVTRE